MKVQSLVGKKIVAIKGDINLFDRRKKPENQRVNADYIFFDDGETFINLDEQDPYTYHDCDRDAKNLIIIVDKYQYDNLIKSLRDSTEDL